MTNAETFQGMVWDALMSDADRNADIMRESDEVWHYGKATLNVTDEDGVVWWTVSVIDDGQCDTLAEEFLADGDDMEASAQRAVTAMVEFGLDCE
jgi:hypothetical protein